MSLILVDGSALFYRAHYAFAGRPLTSPTGEPTSVAFGFCMGVLRVIEERRPQHLAVVFDRPGPVFRHAMYPAYKANRKPMPPELAVQLPRLREVLDAWGVAVLERDGFEADDLMATLARLSAGVADRVWFYTGDKDFQQLLDERTGMLKPGARGAEIVEVGPQDVQREFGVAPRTLVDVFALCGDSSDNIPGAPGIGVKTAAKLVADAGSLDELYRSLDRPGVTARLRRILLENRDQVELSRRLFTIDEAVPLTPDWEAMRTVLPTNAAARALLADLGLRQVQALSDRLQARGIGAAPLVPEPSADSGATPSGPAPGPDYRLLATPKDLTAWLNELPQGVPLAVDTETDGLRTDRARLVGVSLAVRPGAAVYIPVLERRGEAQGSLFAAAAETDHLAWIRPLLAPVLADPVREKVGQNLKFDEWILARHGLPLGGPRFDTMVAAYVLDPSRPSFGLDELSQACLGVTPIPYAGLFAENDRVRDILGVPLDRLCDYAAEDADLTLRLRERFAAELAAAPQLERLFRDLEMPLSEILYRMERRGIRVDTAMLSTVGDRFREELAVLEARIHEHAGGPFNVQSPKQLAEILFGRLKLKPSKKTASGWSTDVSVLEDLAAEHPLPALVLEHRQLAKLLGTYVEALVELVDPATGLVHTSFNQAVAATGRLSSSDPNLQNIPVRSENGRLIRRAFVPRDPGAVFLSADYSQIELRLLAHLSGDAELIATFHAGGDVHRRTAALINGVPEADVTSQMRSRAKAINFGVIYGMGARALARRVAVPVREAAAFIDAYFRTYPGVRDYIAATRESARRDGYVTTMSGRRRPLPDLASDDPRRRSLAERMAVNTPIQGTAADLIKEAMLRVDRELRQTGSGALLLLQVHDELLLEVPRDELATVATLVREAMEQVADLAVPLLVDVHDGADWAEAHG
ncbi:MAG: DNA polymerase I [Candidatus Latescibacteria bacterium]|nr:DNA polymerase I [Candidatus Latescibacterota bacterium]